MIRQRGRDTKFYQAVAWFGAYLPYRYGILKRRTLLIICAISFGHIIVLCVLVPTRANVKGSARI